MECEFDKDVTIIVNSCDKYEDAWEPFFFLLKKYWPQCEKYKIILNTESKVYDCDFLNIETICGGQLTWSKRIKNVLKEVKTELVVFLLEDFFLKSPLNQNDFQKIVNEMIADSTIGYVGLKYRPERKLLDGSEPSTFFVSRDMLPVNLRVPLISSIWRTKYFIKLLRNHETPWDFEHYAGIRSRRLNYKVLDVNNNDTFCRPIFEYDIDMQYGIGIAKGKWLMPKTKEYLEQFGFDINYEILGTDNETYYRANGLLKEDKKKEEIVGDKKSDIVESLYNVKKCLTNSPRNIKKYIRKIKSLI